MSSLSVFLLVLAAFVGTVMFLTDPTRKMAKWARGKKQSELNEKAKQFVEENDTSVVLAKGCGFVLFISLASVYSFLIEPFAVITAITRGIGNQPLAYTMLGIVLISWVSAIYGFVRSRANNAKVEKDEELDFGSPFWLGVRRYFFALPTLYLWYLAYISLF